MIKSCKRCYLNLVLSKRDPDPSREFQGHERDDGSYVMIHSSSLIVSTQGFEKKRVLPLR
jgi:hypothetical protein